MNVQELINKGSMTGKDRITLYLSESKVEHVYVQTVAQVTELVQTRNKGVTFSAGLGEILGGEITAEGGLEQKVAITPLLQAIITEKVAEKAELLIDLARQKPVEGPLILGPLMRYIGPARFTGTVLPLTPDDTTIPQQAWDIISRKQQIQEAIIKWKNKEAATVVLTFTKENAVYASIASNESLNISLFASYSQTPPFGILCRMEGPPEKGVTFLDPIWIWHESR